MSLFVVDCVEREERSDFREHLEDAEFVVGFASFFLYLFGLTVHTFLNPTL